MKINKPLIIYLFYCLQLSSPSLSQTTIRLTENIQLLKVDILNQIYTLTEDQYIKKWDKEGRLLFQYIHNRDGIVSHVDVRNPLQILLFYEDQQRIISLDRTLSPLQEWTINREDWGFISCIATGKNDRIWLFDRFNYQLGSIQKDGRAERQKTDLIACCTHPPEINFMAMTEQYLFLFDRTQGIIKCDILGQFIQFIPLKEWQSIFTYGNTIRLIKDGYVLEIDSSGQTRELSNIKNPLDIIGYTHKEIYYYQRGKSDTITLISYP
jgi:hypothetical protein